jgi:hypothetical protein
MSQFYIRRRLENLEQTGPKLSLVDLITFDQEYISWYRRVYGPTELMLLLEQD